jgi:hypothetical protein
MKRKDRGSEEEETPTAEEIEGSQMNETLAVGKNGYGLVGESTDKLLYKRTN